jgi:hypothetical protein
LGPLNKKKSGGPNVDEERRLMPKENDRQHVHHKNSHSFKKNEK